MIKLPWYYWLYANQKGFESRNEIGLSSAPTINTIAACDPGFDTPNEADFPFNQSLGYHDAAGMFQSVCKIVYQDVGRPSSLAEMIRWCDLYNNQVYRGIFEAANKARPRNEGTMIWRSNAAWPSFSHQLYDWNLRANAGYDTMKSACKPLHVQFSHDDAGVQVVSTLGVNVVDAIVKVAIFSTDGKKQTERQFEVDIDANQTVHIGTIKGLIDSNDLYFIGLDLQDRTGHAVDRTVVWAQKETKWDQLLSIPPVDVACKLVDRQEIDGEIEYSFEVTNASALPVVNMMMEITDGAFGDEILPAFWEDNALTMVPRETRTVKVGVRKDLITGPPLPIDRGAQCQPCNLGPDHRKRESTEPSYRAP